MPCEILIKNVSNTDRGGTDPHTARQTWKRGYPVLVKDLPHPGWGGKEGLPEFIILRITDAVSVQVNEYIQSYHRTISFTTVTHNVPQDEWRILLEATNMDVSQHGKITKDEVETYLNAWNAVVQSFTATSVVFDVKISDAIKSIGFWDIKAGEAIGLVLTEINYDTVTGEHTQVVDYSNFRPTIIDRDKVVNRLLSMIEERRGTVSDDNRINQTITFALTASDVKQQFLWQLQERHPKIVWRKQFYFPIPVCNTIENYMQNNNGEPYETNRATAIAYLNNKLNE